MDTHLLLAFVISSMTTRPFRDGALFLLLIDIPPTFRRPSRLVENYTNAFIPSTVPKDLNPVRKGEPQVFHNRVRTSRRQGFHTPVLQVAECPPYVSSTDQPSLSDPLERVIKPQDLGYETIFFLLLHPRTHYTTPHAQDK